jgi:hypothetical protein
MYGLLAESYSESSQRESSVLSVRVGILGSGHCPRLGGRSAKPNFLGVWHALVARNSQLYSDTLLVLRSINLLEHESVRGLASICELHSDAGIDTKCNFQLRMAHLTFLEAIDDPPL